MDSSNLATVFGPNILRRARTDKHHHHQLDSIDEMAQSNDVIAVVKDLIDFHAAVFRVQPSSLLSSFVVTYSLAAHLRSTSTRQVAKSRLVVRGRIAVVPSKYG